METTLKVLVFGAGAIGTYIGGSLEHVGNPVVFLERPPAALEVQERGLYLELFDKTVRIEHPLVVSTIEAALELGPYDVAVSALKSFDTQTVLQSLRPFKDRLPPVLCLQNGVDNEARWGAELGPNKVIAGTVTSSIARLAVGQISLEKFRGIGIAANHQLSHRLFKAGKLADLNPRLYANTSSMKWSKLITNLLVNAAPAILNLTPAEILTHPGLYQLEITQLKEALSVMHALGIRVVDLPATPVRLLAFGVRYLPPRLSRPFLQRGAAGGRGGKMPSLYIDLHNGRPESEVIDLNGAVVRYGTLQGVPTPANQALTEALMRLVRREVAIESFSHQPDKLLEIWKSLSSRNPLKSP